MPIYLYGTFFQTFQCISIVHFRPMMLLFFLIYHLNGAFTSNETLTQIIYKRFCITPVKKLNDFLIANGHQLIGKLPNNGLYCCNRNTVHLDPLLFKLSLWRTCWLDLHNFFTNTPNVLVVHLFFAIF